MTVFALLLIVGAGVAYATLDALRKLMAKGMSSLAALLWLTLGALPFFAVWVLKQSEWKIDTGYWTPTLVAVGLQLIANLAFIEAVKRSPLSVTIPLLSLTPVFTAVAAIFTLGEWPGMWKTLGILVVTGGAWWLARISIPSNGERRSFWALLKTEPGVPLMVLTSLAWAVAGPLDKVALRYLSASGGDFGKIAMHALVMNLGVAMGAFAMLAWKGRLGQSMPQKGSWGVVIGAAVASSVALAFQLSAVQVAMVALVESIKRGVNTILALLLGAVIFSEEITGAKVAACAVMTLGVVLIWFS